MRSSTCRTLKGALSAGGFYELETRLHSDRSGEATLNIPLAFIELIHAGHIQSIKFGRSRRLTTEQIQSFLRDHEVTERVRSWAEVAGHRALHPKK